MIPTCLHTYHDILVIVTDSHYVDNDQVDYPISVPSHPAKRIFGKGQIKFDKLNMVYPQWFATLNHGRKASQY